MARVNIYLPDELARRAREAGLNVSGIAQEAIHRELLARDLDAWLAMVKRDRPLTAASRVELEQVMDEVREESARAADKYVDPERYDADVEALGEGRWPPG